MSEEHEPIDINKYVLPSGKWRVRYYKTVNDETEWMQEIYDLKEPTSIASLMKEGYRIGSCWQMD